MTSKSKAKPKPPVSLSFWIALCDIPEKDETKALAAAHAASRTLATYLNKSGAKASFGGINPSAASVKDGDLLVHVCVRSLIEGIAERLNLTTERQTGGTGGGATANMDGQGTLSEVYWPVVMGKGVSSDAGRGKVLANLAFHEFVHNKCDSADADPHTAGGGSVLLPKLNTALMRSEPAVANFTFMKQFIDRRVKQYPYCLFSDILGY